MNFAKWIHVKIRGWKGLATILVPNSATVTDLKAMLGIEHYTCVTVPASFLPLADDTIVYECVNEFDTVIVEP